MDLTKLIHNETPSEQTSTRNTNAAPQHGILPPNRVSQYAPAPQQSQHSYDHGSRQHTLSRQSSLSQQPALTPTGQPHPYSQSQSPASFYAPGPSAYAARSGSAVRPQTAHDQPVTPIQYQAGLGGYGQAHTTLSPTPPSHTSQTSRSNHQSPMPSLQHGGPPPQYPGQYGQQRSNEYYDSRASPQSQRQSLGPPVRAATDSLASPIALLRQSPGRRSSGQLGYNDREQSAEVSPKTMTMPRPLSMGSRQSSLQESTPAYYPGPPSESSHFNSRSSQNPPSSLPHQPPARSHSQVSSVASVPHAPPHSASPAFSQPSTQPTNHSAPPERPTVKRSHTMTMDNLLAPKDDALFPATQPEVKKEPDDSVLANGVDQSKSIHENRKRAPEDELASARPAKKGKTTRSVERPIWAQLSKRNPRWTTENGFKGEVKPPQNGHPRSQRQARNEPSNGAVLPNNNAVDRRYPWNNSMPIDMDLVNARELLGDWEKSIKWVTPYPSMLQAVQEWLRRHLEQHQDVAQDPSLGTIEIEAKIGRLVKPNTGERASLPVLCMTVLDPSVNRDYRFESELTENDFITLNTFLNQTLKDSLAPGRKRMDYGRVLELDSFAQLSPGGHELLPKSLSRQQMHGRELKLRSTENLKTHEITARIVKVPIADLHIYNPHGYDCRISMNAEVNMMRPGLRYESLVAAATDDKPVPPSRRKDRLSYKHLVYQIDLTNVQVSGLPPKYEMEIEVDARTLGAQIKLMSEGKPHAYGDVVSGLLDNATYLMRQQ